MAEKVFKPSAAAVSGKHKEKTAAHTRKGLSILNGEINTRKRNINTLKQSVTFQKPAISSDDSYSSNPSKLKILYQNKASECKASNKENADPAPSTSLCASSPECIEGSPNTLKNVVLSYSNKEEKKKMVRSDFIWITPYRQDIYAYLRGREEMFLPKPNYMAKQTDISMNMRSILVDWFIEVGEEYNMHSETLHLAVNYVDRFLSKKLVTRGKLQLVGTTSLLLASKLEEIDPPELKELVSLTDYAYTRQQFLSMEHFVLLTLNGDLAIPTANNFLLLYCSMCNASESLIYLSQYICELSLVNGDEFLHFKPSLIAAGSVALANFTMGFNMWGEDIAKNSGYQLLDLQPVILCLYRAYSGVGGSAFQAVYEKYKKEKFGCIANVRHPPQLVFPNKSNKNPAIFQDVF